MPTLSLPTDKHAYLFDVDGVLLRVTTPFSTRFERETGLPEGTTAPFFHGVFQECLVGKADLREELEHHLPAWGWAGGVDAFLEWWFASEIDLNKELLERIAELKQARKGCFIATNQDPYRAAHLADTLGLAERVGPVFASGHVGAKKPDPAFFEHVLDEIGMRENPADVFYVDDDPHNVASARDIGIHAVHYQI